MDYINFDSFIIIGRYVGSIYDSKLKLDFKNKSYCMFGKTMLTGGIDLVYLNEETYNWIIDRKFNLNFENGDIIEIIKNGENSYSSDSIIIPDNLVNACAYYIKKNNYSSKTIKDLEKNYIYH